MYMTQLVAHMTDTPLPHVMVSLKGIEGLGRKSLAFLFSTQKAIACEIVDEHPNAINIIDIDDYRGKAAWESLHSQHAGKPHAPVIVLGREPMDVENGVLLQKPFRPQQLLAAVESLAAEVRQQLESAFQADETEPNNANSTEAVADKAITASVSTEKKGLSQSAASSLNERETFAHIGTRADVDLNDPRALAEVQYDPDQFLASRMLELMKLAANEHKYIRIGCCDVAFYIDPHERCVRTRVKEKNLRTFGALPLDGARFKHHKEARLPADIETQGLRLGYEAFIWRLILASSRGRLPENTDLDQRFVLRRWPNLTRLMLFPHATQISAIWVSSPKSIREVIELLGIPQRYVFAFFAVTSLMGYLRPTDPLGSNTAQPAVKPKHKRRGLFRRLLKTLYRKQDGTSDD